MLNSFRVSALNSPRLFGTAADARTGELRTSAHVTASALASNLDRGKRAKSRIANLTGGNGLTHSVYINGIGRKIHALRVGDYKHPTNGGRGIILLALVAAACLFYFLCKCRCSNAWGAP